MDNTTRSLSRILENIKDTESGKEFIENNTSKELNLSSLLNEYIGDNNLKIPDIIRDSGLTTSYVYNILNGDKNPGRDKIIALCIGMHMNYSMTQRTLETAKQAPLYPKDERDARIAIAINMRVKDVTRVNLILDEYGLEEIKVNR